VCKFDVTYFIQYSVAEYERMKSSVYNLRLNTGSDGNDETKGGKLFQTRAAVTGNARSPFVECFDRRMTSTAKFDDQRHRGEAALATRVSSADRHVGAVPC